ncbi:hypothetical protein J3F83DRAFT_730620, partial [Trichoderma novae-zelandiae]
MAMRVYLLGICVCSIGCICQGSTWLSAHQHQSTSFSVQLHRSVSSLYPTTGDTRQALRFASYRHKEGDANMYLNGLHL